MTKRTGKAGGPAPFGFQFDARGYKVPHPTEASIRRRVAELFIEHRRVGTVATMLTRLGLRTRSSAPFSDTTIRRLLMEPAPGIVPDDLHEQCLTILQAGDPGRPPKHLFVGLTFHACGQKMVVPSDLPPKYVCPSCKAKIPADDLEAIFRAKLPTLPLTNKEAEHLRGLADGVAVGELGSSLDLQKLWPSLLPKEKRSIVEQLVGRIVVGDGTIAIQFYDLRSTPSEDAAETHRVVESPEPLPLVGEPMSESAPEADSKASRVKKLSVRVAPTRTAPSPDQETLTLREAAHLLRLSESRVRVMVADGRLPSFRTGTGPKARIRVWRKDLDAAAAENFQVQTREEEAEAAEREIAALLAARKKRKR